MNKIGISERIKDQTGKSPLFSSNFILAPNRTPDPRADAYLDASGAPLTGSDGFALMKPQDPAFIQYLYSQGIVQDPNRLIQVGENKEAMYPHGSAEAALLQLLEDDIVSIRNQVAGSAFYPNFVTEDAIQVAQKLDIPFGNIADHEQQHAMEISDVSHSKSFLRSQADIFGFSIAEGRVIKNSGPLASHTLLKNTLLDLQSEVKSKHSLSSEELNNVEYWLKFDALSGGDGTINISSPITEKKINNAREEIISIAQKCGMDISNFPMPLVLEAGANSIPGKNVIGNINAQALIGEDDDIRMSETSVQQTDETGGYLGNSLPFLDADAIAAVESEYEKVCKAYQDIGYRGMVGSDAIVSKNSDGSYKVEWFDVNPRANGSQAFQEEYRMFADKYPHLAGLNLNLQFPENVSFQKFRNQLGELLFNKDDLGVLPVAFRSTESYKSPIVKCSVLQQSSEDLRLALQAIQKLGITV